MLFDVEAAVVKAVLEVAFPLCALLAVVDLAVGNQDFFSSRLCSAMRL